MQWERGRLKWEGGEREEGEAKEGRAVEMESKKRRMLDPRVIRGKETEWKWGERRKEKRAGLGEKKKKNIAMQKGCNEFVPVFQPDSWSWLLFTLATVSNGS